MTRRKEPAVQEAVAMVAAGIGPYAAALACGACPGSVYSAVRRQRAPGAAACRSLNAAIRTIELALKERGPAGRRGVVPALESLLRIARA